MKIYAIGDIHGCLNELKKLLEIVDKSIQKDDEIVFLGDYIDRGPDSKGVIDLLIERSKTHPNKHIFLKGNHEDMMVSERNSWLLNGGMETLQSYGITDAADWIEFWKFIPTEHKQFLSSLDYIYKVGRAVFVHAGIEPSVKYEEQIPNICMWTRAWVGYDGEYYDNEYVVYGHTPNYKVVERKNQLGIDTACVFGGKLTCAVIDPGGDYVRLIDVHSEFDWK